MLKDTYYILLRMHRVDKKKAKNAESLKIINNFKEGYGAWKKKKKTAERPFNASVIVREQ